MGQLNLSEEGKLINFGEYASTVYEKAIKEREKSIKAINEEKEEIIERAKEILSEYEEDLQTTALNIDTTAINTRNDRERYFEEYDATLSHALAIYDRQKEYIDSVEKKYSSTIDQIKEEIAVLNRKLTLIGE